MHLSLRLFLYFFLACLFAGVSAHAEPHPIVCGVAKGYPPYQFRDESGRPIGLDVEVLSQVFTIIDVSYRFEQKDWDDVVANLRYGDLDCAIGMEMSEIRLESFDFSVPYYIREISLFLLEKEARIETLDDLVWRVIAGDRHSAVEEYFSEIGLKNKIRIIQTNSKDESMRLLKEGQVTALIAPKAVGFYLAKKHEVQVKTLPLPLTASPVGIAVKKGNGALLKKINDGLEKLKQQGKLEPIINRWRQ